MSIIIYACIEPFDFTVDTTEKVLVVEGGITNMAQAHEVILSYSYALEADNADFLSDARLTIVSGSGEIETLISQGDGVYVTNDSYSGQIGESYQLIIEAGDSRYESTFETLLDAPEIDSIYGKYSELPNEETNRLEGNVQFFIDTHDQSLASSYYRYEWEDAYQILVPFPSYLEVVNNEIVSRKEYTGVCYDYDTSSSLIIATSINSFENQLKEFPVFNVSENSQTLRTRMGLLIKQYAISENAYGYYRKLRENQDASGSLFDIQAGTVVGNMVNTGNADEVVLGFFEVAGMTQKRSFFNPGDFWDQGLRGISFKYDCERELLVQKDEAVTLVLNSYPFYEIEFYKERTDSVYMHPRTCSSCNWYADTTPPEFWIR